MVFTEVLWYIPCLYICKAIPFLQSTLQTIIYNYIYSSQCKSTPNKIYLSASPESLHLIFRVSHAPSRRCLIKMILLYTQCSLIKYNNLLFLPLSAHSAQVLWYKVMFCECNCTAFKSSWSASKHWHERAACSLLKLPR